MRNKSKSELLTQLESLKKDLSTLRTTQNKPDGKNARVARIGGIRKNIARVMTVMNQDTKSKLRAHYAAKGGPLPTDLRVKATRAIRRRLTPAQAAKVTTKQAKKDSNFPMRTYAVKP
jgi:large subunit ribosomal protein L35e